MSHPRPPGFWERQFAGRRRFSWREPRAFVRLRLQQSWREIRSPTLIALLAAFPCLAFLMLWLSSRILDEPFDWVDAGFRIITGLGGAVLLGWLAVKTLLRFSQVIVRERGFSWGGTGCMWERFQSFALVKQTDYAVLALIPPKGKPLFLGVPFSVALDELEAFLLSRGLERAVDAAGLAPHLHAATRRHET